MHLQEVTQELAAILIKYRCEQYQSAGMHGVKNNKKTTCIRLSPESINQQEEIAKKILIGVTKMNIYINHIDSSYLLEGYQHTLLSMLHEACTELHRLEKKTGVMLDLRKTLNSYIKKLKRASYESYSDIYNEAS